MNDYPGPLTPEEIARAQAYYGGAGISSSAAAPPPPPAPVTDLGEIDPVTHLGEIDARDPVSMARDYYAPPVRDLGEIDAPQKNIFGGPAGSSKPAAANPSTLTGGDFAIGADRLSASDLAAGKAAPTKITANVNAGPSTKDDREFAAFRHYQDTAKKPAKSGGGGAAGPANPDPYGVKGAQKAYLGTFDAEEAAIRAGSTAESEKASALGTARGFLAELQQKDAMIREREIADAQKGFDAHMGEIQRQADEVRAKKIDPHRIMRGDGAGVTAVLGGIFGGFYMGLNKLSSNPFLDDLNKQFDRDIAAQEKDLENERAGVTNKMNVLREQRATFKDNDIAKLQTKSLMYAAAERAIEAKGAEYDEPIAKARMEQAVSTIQRERGKIDLSIKTAVQQHQQAMAAAGAAQARAQQLEMRKAFGDTYEKHIAAGSSPATAEAEATRMVKNLFGGGAGERPAAATGAGSDPLANVPKTERTEAAKELREHSDRENAKKALSTAFTNFLAAGVTDRSARDAFRAQARGLLKPHMKGANSDVDMDQLINPLIPEGGFTTDGAQQAKLGAALALLDAEGTTPLLDRHSPGWKGAEPVKQTGTDGKTPKR